MASSLSHALCSSFEPRKRLSYSRPFRATVKSDNVYMFVQGNGVHWPVLVAHVCSLALQLYSVSMYYTCIVRIGTHCFHFIKLIILFIYFKIRSIGASILYFSVIFYTNPSFSWRILCELTCNQTKCILIQSI